MTHADDRLGLPDGVIELAPASSEWGRLYEEEAARIRSALGELILDIQHVGSTAIPGIAAKPILDIDVGVPSFEEGERAIEPLEAQGYTYRGEHGIPGRHYFVKGNPRTHHLHMYGIDHALFGEQAAFRDALRADPVLAREYERLKQDLARRFRTDRVAYTDGKTKFVYDVLRRD